jgi:hypothetical protein
MVVFPEPVTSAAVSPALMEKETPFNVYVQNYGESRSQNQYFLYGRKH